MKLASATQGVEENFFDDLKDENEMDLVYGI
jgi:hypothetical protein